MHKSEQILEIRAMRYVGRSESSRGEGRKWRWWTLEQGDVETLARTT